MKEKMYTKDVKALYTVLGDNPIKAIDTNGIVMRGISYTIENKLSIDHIQYMTNRYNNVFIYKSDNMHCIGIFPRSLNLLYNE